MRSVPIIAAAVMAAVGSSAVAQSPDPNLARNLAATCANCHGADGRSATKEVISLAGLPKNFLLDQMKAFKEGKRPATIMHQLAKGYTDAQIELIADYFAGQKP